MLAAAHTLQKFANPFTPQMVWLENIFSLKEWLSIGTGSQGNGGVPGGIQ